MPKTHYDVMKEVGDDWGFRRDFIRSLTIARTEYKDKHPMAYAFGADVEKTGRYNCELCDKYLSEPACDGYRRWIKDILKRRIVDEYIQPTCPDCHTPIENKRPAVVADPIVLDEATEKINDFEEEKKTEYQPCGCLHEPDEEKIRWDLDKEAIVEDFDGKVFKRGEGPDKYDQEGKENHERR